MSDILSALIGALAVILVQFLISLQGRTQLFSNIVSKERMIWIKEVRELSTKLCSICEQYETQAQMPPEQYAAFLQARNGLLLYLDPQGKFTTDDELIELLKIADFQTIRGNVPRIREILADIFKVEWDVVKLEAGNGSWIANKISKKRQPFKSNLTEE